MAGDYYRDLRIQWEITARPRNDPPAGHSWHLDRMLGEGGHGRAYLWNLVTDSDQQIVDRVVLKYTSMRPADFITHGGPGNGQIKEVFLQKALAPSGTAPNEIFTVPVLAAEHCSWSIDAWRIYSPFFSFGDLEGLIKTQGERPQHRQIPEPFAWYMLHRLAYAAVVMDTAVRTSETDYQVVHVDLKPENIFLGAPGSLGKHSSFPAYPPAYIGDFGNAHITHTGDVYDHLMVGMCTDGWAAPEISSKKCQGLRKHWQVPGSSKTNIWQIGYNMISILQGIYDHYTDPDWAKLVDREYAPAYRQPPIPPPHPGQERPLQRQYSEDLLDLLHSCVAFTADDRPTPQELLDDVNRLMVNHTEGMEHWGTLEWFEQENAAADGPSPSAGSEHGSSDAEDTPLRDGEEVDQGIVADLINSFKYILCIPSARPGRQRRRSRSGSRVTKPISLSPFSRARARDAALKRRQAIVSRQIHEGLTPPLRRYVSTDPADDRFVLHDDLKLIHSGHQRTNKDYFTAPEPVAVRYREDIDDIDEFYRERRRYERDHPNDSDILIGETVHSFRKPGVEAGEPAVPDEEAEESYYRLFDPMALAS